MDHLSAGAGSQKFVLKNILLPGSPRVVIVKRFLSAFLVWAMCMEDATKASGGGSDDVTLCSMHGLLQNRIAWTLEATMTPETDGDI